MEAVKVLGVVGSPRKNANTAKLVKKALEGAMTVPGVETEFYEIAGKTFHHCIGCSSKCAKKGTCVWKDDLQDFINKYMEADGIIWGAPVYHMGVPSLMKALYDRLCAVIWNNYGFRGKEIPRLNKVCGVLTIGATRYGGQDLTLSFMVNSALLMNGVVVSGDTTIGNYIGATGYTGGDSLEQLTSKDVVLKDKEGMACAENLGKRVAEMTKIVRAGLSALRKELPSEYFPTWDPL